MKLLTIPRLQQAVEIADKEGKPSFAFHRWWDSVASSVEDSVNKLFDSLVTLGLLRPDGTINDNRVTSGSIVENGVTTTNIAPNAVVNESIATSAVTTSSILTDSVTERYLSTNLSDIELPDGTETEVLSLTVVKSLSSSEIDIDIAVRLESTDDIIGDVKVYRGTTLVDSFSPYLKGASDTYRTIFTFPFTEFNIPSGSYVYSVKFTKDGGATTLKALKGSIIRMKEIKR
jgi:hypothetical protein